jgi:two-component system, sporulation sensor kinase D
MNLYSKKQRWKVFLLILAACIVLVSLWYTNIIANKIREEERQKVQLWSEAIKRKAKLVNYTQKLFANLRDEERKKVDLWASATSKIPTTDNTDYLNFLLNIVTNNQTVPVVVLDNEGNLSVSRNVDEKSIENKTELRKLVKEMGNAYAPIEIEYIEGSKLFLYYKDSKIITDLEETLDDIINSFISETVINSASVPVILTDSTKTQIIKLGNIDPSSVESKLLLQKRLANMAVQNQPIQLKLENKTNFIFYEDSMILKQLKYYPYIQLLIIFLFLFIAYLMFSTFRKAEQDQVWIGLAKETAHQLGTPLSSLMAWIDLLEAKGLDKSTVEELNKDIKRLETITDRFSKIGSQPELESTVLTEALEQTISYLIPRVSSKIVFDILPNETNNIRAKINKPLFSWVIENICKNAIDAMDGKGKITLSVSDEIQQVYLDITDTGKGIPSNLHKAVFQPGYTTKRRGWGLGLSLAKRIIDNYHSGKIFIKRSQQNTGTTFRIVLKKQ